MSRRITALSFLDAPVVTGPARGLINLARALPVGARLHVALLRGRGAPPVPRLDELTEGALTTWELPELGPFDPLLFVRAAKLARAVGADLVQSHSYKPHVLAMGVSKALRLPWVGHHHGWTAENDKVRLYHRVDALTLPRADRVVAVARAAKTIVVEEGCDPSKVEVIPNAVDRSDFESALDRDAARDRLGLPRDAVIACVVGRLSHEKGQDLALQALARVRAEGHALTLALAGDGPDREKLESLARELSLGDSVRFLGHQRQVGVVYKAADLLVMPSRSEAMPNALLEAMTLGLPVVATRVGGVPEVTDEGVMALVVDPESAPALAAAIVETLTQPEARARRVEVARDAAADRHDPGRRAARYVGLWESVLDARR